MQDLVDSMTAKFKETGLPHESIQVFGHIRLNVHVKCIGRETADKWAQVLAHVLKGGKVTCTPHTWDVKRNKGTVLKPTKRNGFLICAFV